MGFIDHKEHKLMARITEAEKRLEKLDGQAIRRETEVRMLEAAEELDLVRTAKAALAPAYLGKFIKCTSCRRVFADEGSYLAHWEYSARGRIGCVFTEAILHAKGFVVDEHTDYQPPLYVIRHPRNESK